MIFYITCHLFIKTSHFLHGIDDKCLFNACLSKIIAAQEPFSENEKQIRLGNFNQKFLNGGHLKFTEVVTKMMKKLISK